MTDSTQASDQGASGTTREERLRIVEALIPGFWGAAAGGTRVGGMLKELDDYVANGPKPL